MDLRTIAKLLEPLRRQIRLLLSYGVVRLVDASYKAQRVQVSAYAGETMEARHWEPYGYTAHPLAGAEALLGSQGGDRAYTDAIVVADRRYRLTTLASGEVAIYDDLGQKVHLTRNGIVVVSPLVTIQAAQTHITGALQVDGAINCDSTIDADGNITSAGEMADSVGTMSGMRDTYNGHTHNETSTVTAAPNQSM